MGLKTNFLILISFFFISTITEATTLFTPPTLDYDDHIYFNADDMNNWTYTGGREDFNFDKGMMRFNEHQYPQYASYDKALVNNMNSYGMEFTMTIRQMGEAGDRTRPILMIIPRGKSNDFKQQYAVTYYLETLRMGQIVANLYQVHWAIINTNSPNGMSPLVEGSYIMNENIPYQGRLSIENMDNGDVELHFFVDGPTDPASDYKPLLYYCDKSAYKINESSIGPTFATVGYDDDVWGHNPIVEIDNLKLYGIDAFKARTTELTQYAKTWISEKVLKNRYRDTKFLTNQRIILTTLTGDLELNKNATIGDLLFGLYAVDNGDYKKIEDRFGKQKDLQLTRERASEILYDYMTSPSVIEDYKVLVSDAALTDNHLHYAYQKGYIPLENGRIRPNQVMKRDDLINFLLGIVNPKAAIPQSPLFVPDIINNNAIIQRNRPIYFWGQGMNGDTVSISFGDKTLTSPVKDGQWQIEFPPKKAGGPYRLSIKDSHRTLEFDNIYIGEVFLVAGQSNAEMPLAETRAHKSIMNKYLNRDVLRFFYNDFLIATSPNKSANGNWFKSQEWVLNESAAIGTYFSDYIRLLNSNLHGVKIGLIRLTYGGSTIELFLQPDQVNEMIYKQRHHDPLMSGFWNGFMDYIPPYQIKGVLYYQGENSSQLKYSYEPLLRRYIKGLRKAFKQDDLPIILVQIAGYGDNFYTTDNDSWPKIREVQMRVAKTTDNVELVTAIDLVDPNPLEIHPIDKKPIGKRLAHMAMSLIYGKSNYIRSAEVTSHTLDGNTYTLDVAHTGKGLTYQYVGPDDFEIRDENGHWHHANSKIINKTQIQVWQEGMVAPQGVRYAWRNYPSSNYYNSYGLPMLPFNSTVDLTKTDTHHLETNTFQIKSTNHLMQTFDAIENVTRLSEFRMIRRQDGNIVTHDFFIYGQQAGDQIRKYKRLLRVNTAAGTNETIVVIRNHDLNVGDWIRNNTRAWMPRKVLEIIDHHTFRVTAVPNQQSGDLIERYRYMETITAE